MNKTLTCTKLGASRCKVRQKQTLGKTYLVGAIHLKLNAHFTACLVLPGSRVDQRCILVIGVVLCHHHIEHHTGVGDLQVFTLCCLKLQCITTPVGCTAMLFGGHCASAVSRGYTLHLQVWAVDMWNDLDKLQCAVQFAVCYTC